MLNPQTSGPGAGKSGWVSPSAQVVALLEALLPPHGGTPTGEQLYTEVQKALEAVPVAHSAFLALVALANVQSMWRFRRPLSRLTYGQRAELVAGLAQHPLHKYWLHALSFVPKFVYLLNDSVAKEVDLRVVVPPQQEEPARWRSQIMSFKDLSSSEGLAVDAIVIGSGAGGAVAAWELASQGLAVLILEEGAYHTRKDFDGDVIKSFKTLYRASGLTGAVGNSWIPIPVGRGVGGTTTVNCGTCMRTPASVLKDWQLEGLDDFTPEQMKPFFDEVESILQVAPADLQYIGAIADVIDAGAAGLKIQGTRPLLRNAPGCDGQGLCIHGCPTDAKQSTNVSFIPRALQRGAFLATGARAQAVTFDGSQVTGVIVGDATGDGAATHVKARHVICSAGSLGTPPLLGRSGIRLPWLGRNLSIHPAGSVSARFSDRSFDSSRVIPQGYGIHGLEAEGIRFEGAGVPISGYGLMLPYQGKRFVDAVRRYQNMAFFGFMVKDEGRGRVSTRVHGSMPLITYRMTERDFGKFRRGVELLAKIYLNAGAEEVLIAGFRKKPVIRNRLELDHAMEQLRSPRDVIISAYHPLGTARLGVSPQRAVCGPDHQVFGTKGLYVMDGSSMPSSLGVNPQITIMAMALRASRRLASRSD